ncbi:MAG: nitroreductase family protein [Candidatus Gracilibacteria bacterium]|jgi:nitroreductase|nr:nitroreductase family protein [Candidatus Gracilibacteria bacterium]
MKFLDLAKKRRSVRSYKSQQVDRSDIKDILNAGTWAPSAFNLQVMKCFVIQDIEKIQELATKIQELKEKTVKKPFKIKPVKDPVFYEAPTVILVCAEKESSEYAKIDCMFFMQNAFLEAAEKGLGTCAIGATALLEMEMEFKKYLGIPKNWEVLLGFTLGYPQEDQEAPERKNMDIKWS